MTMLKPKPVSIKQFSFDSAAQSFTGEISSTHGLGRVYDDACDEGLTVVGKTDEVVFVVTDEVRDNEGDLTHWTLHSSCGRYSMVLFND
jgi:hypothetical protein